MILVYQYNIIIISSQIFIQLTIINCIKLKVIMYINSVIRIIFISGKYINYTEIVWWNAIIIYKT